LSDTTLFAWERKTEADVKGDFGDPPHAYFMKPSRNQLKTKN